MRLNFPSILLLAGLGLDSGALGSITLRRDSDLTNNLTSNLASAFEHEAKALFSPRTVVSFDGQEWFENVTERWDVYRPPTFKVSVSPATEKDVESAVKLATKFKIPFLATGGRHGYVTTLGRLQNGLAIDLSLLNKFSIDRKAATLTVGPGVRFSQIFGPLYEAGFQVPTGTCACVGMIGATLGAGIGRLDGLDGLMIDALQSVKLVTADGRTITVSEKEHKDLFWGIRGAGQNFGVVVSATYKLKPLYADGVWTSVGLIFSAEQNATYFDVVTQMKVPPQLTIESVISYNATLSQPQVMVTLTWTGLRDEALAAMKPILDIGPRYTKIDQVTYATLSRVVAFGMMDAICARNQPVADRLGAELRDDLAASSGYGGVAVYVNYAHGDEKLENIYGARKLPRLARLKSQYDPENVFRFHHPLPAKYP
ncbi:hypothetical protein MAPG_08189 [Magnaporthiopsis poae ATCC 64411]|uniref:FAD-binding PCMH-type domain-containing protein n=1 Tax=Magnaporthiopsis poae (strain ATCC 64411 / 73-15) TaxID=644358 RepID=A0A0C4E6P3_MAGP6|nr:hypothetical protein MAPG_08189 [Magnaporthiopsis poae ATCC 64411]